MALNEESYMPNFDLKIIELSKNNEIEKLEAVLEEKLNQEPTNIDLWFKLALVELCFPFEDGFKGRDCIEKILAIQENNPIALLLLAYIQFYYLGGLEEALMLKLNSLHTVSDEINSMLRYAASWFYFLKDEQIKEQFLKESVSIYSGHVRNYVHLANAYFAKGFHEEAKGLIKKALGNVVKVYNDDDVVDITDVNEFLNERIKGIYITDVNLKSIEEKLK